MYIVKNAFRCISRSMGRNILIGIIALVIAISSCLGLSIRRAAKTAKEDTLEDMSVLATISFDRQSMMQGFAPGNGGFSGGGFDKDSFSEMMNQSSSLTIEEYIQYSEADSVSGFYYTVSAALNGSDDLLPVTTETDSDSDRTDDSSNDGSDRGGERGPGGMGGFGGMGSQMMMGMDSDFSFEGVSSDRALESFVNGTASITEGEVFSEGTESLDCIISEELSVFNGISVGDTVTVTNPNNEDETYSLYVCGIYSDSSANEGSFSFMGSTSTDPANKIYMSANALEKIVEASADSEVTVTDENTGREFSSALSKSISATYLFDSADDYYAFEEEARELGLSESYTVSSQNLNEFERSLVPLDTLSTMAGWFLLVILGIGGIILVVINIFNIRERKYEIGVLTAMGMKKGKVAMQFIIETFVVMMAAVIIGSLVGCVTSVPVTNALLENQISSKNESIEGIEESFGRPGGDFGMPEGMGTPPDMPDMGGFEGMLGGARNYISSVKSAADLTVVLQMMGIAMLLTLVSGAVSVLFVMRYEPLKILASRD